jgi:hypothetical protein
MRIVDSANGSTSTSQIFTIPAALNNDLIHIAKQDTFRSFIYDRGVENKLAVNGGSFDNNNGISIGGRLSPALGTPVKNGDLYITGNIYEIIVYDRYLTVSETKKIERYLKAKYNFTI